MFGLAICDACCTHGSTGVCLVLPPMIRVAPMRVLEHAYVGELSVLTVWHTTPSGGNMMCYEPYTFMQLKWDS